MFPETATILASRLLHTQIANRPRRILNIGSGTVDYWLREQPYIYEWLMRPLIRHGGDMLMNLDKKERSGQTEFIELLGDAKSIPLAPAAADVVLCLSVLEHELEPDRVVAEAYRVLHPRGVAFFEVPFEYPEHPDPIDTGLRIGTREAWELFLGPRWQVVDFHLIESKTKPGSCTMVEARPA
jgi:ubiquinone/menaquinone biosynthesis C-methylase UbiE